MIHKFSGKLTIPESNDGKYEFGVYNKQEVRYDNITAILNKVTTQSTDYLINVKIKYNDSYVFDSVGELSKDRDHFGILDWHVGQDNLGKVLAELCESNVEVIINDFMVAEDEDDRMSK